MPSPLFSLFHSASSKAVASTLLANGLRAFTSSYPSASSAIAERVKLSFDEGPARPQSAPKKRHPDASILVDEPLAIGYAQWKPGDPLRYSWPLFGTKTVPPPPAEARSLSKTVFGSGARYLGDEEDFCGPGKPVPSWIELPVLGRSNVGKSSLLNALLGSEDKSFVPVSRHPGSTRHLDFYACGDSLRLQKLIDDCRGFRGAPLSGADPSSLSALGEEAKIASAALGGAAPRRNGLAAPSAGFQRGAPGKETMNSSQPLGKRRRDGTYERASTSAAPSSQRSSKASFSAPAINPFAVPFAQASNPEQQLPKAELVLVDTPGYGYNSTRGKTAEHQWLSRIKAYLRSRPPHVVPRALVLIDAKTGMLPIDKEVLALLDESGTPYQLALTKADSISPLELEVTAEAVARQAAKAALPYPVLCAVSSLDGKGMETLKEQLVLSTRLHRRLLGGMV